MSSAGLSIGELVGTVSLNDTFSPGINKVAESLGFASESFKAITGAAGLAAGAVVGATTAIVALGLRGAQVADVQDAFSGLTARAGETADVMLGALQSGTQGTISNFELMKMANATLGSGLVSSAADMETLAAGAKLLADRTGGDTATAFDTLTGAMASGKTAALKQLGVFVDSKVAVEDYARSIGKSAGDLTTQERATALAQATVAALNRELKAAGPPVKDFGDLIDIGKAAVQNFTDNLAVAVAQSPVVRAGLEAISGAVQGAFGGNQQDTVKTLIGYVNKFAIFLVEAAQVGVEGARFISNAFDGTKVIFNAFLGAVAGGLAEVSGFLADLAEKGSSLPGTLGENFKATAGGLRSMADTADSLAIGFNEMAEQAVDSAATTNAGFDAVHATLGATEEAMRAALGAEADLGAAAPTVATGLGTVAEAGRLSAEQMKAMEDATRKGQEALLDLATNGAATFQTLQDQLTLANLTGVEARLFEINQARDQEIAGVQGLALSYPALYEQITAAVTEKYGIMTAAAQGHFATVELAAADAGFKTQAALQATADNAVKLYADMLASGKFSIDTLQQAWDAAEKAKTAATRDWGFKTRDEQQQTADKAKKLYDEMLASGRFTDGELQRAHRAYTDAVKAMDNEQALNARQQFDIIAGAATGILKSVFGKSKAAAIAATIINTSQAVVKTFAQYGWPWGIIPAAAMLAAGYAEIRKIQSTEAGFAMGTPGTAFEDFGRGTSATLHGQEAVVTKAQGETLAEMVQESVQAADARTAAQLRGLRADLASDRRDLPRRLAVARMFATA